LALGLLVILAGCQEINSGIDGLLGRKSPVLSSASHATSADLVPVKKRSPGVPPEATKPDTPDRTTVEPPKRRPAGKKAASAVPEGKRRAPGSPPPTTADAGPTPEGEKTAFTVVRDPFKKPTEILPTECPPSMPLCRFDRSQLKLVGVIQINEGQFKGMVEDPDGRGYFVTPGQQILGATITQVSYKGVILRDHKTKQDVLMPLYVEAKETGEL
jgi:hypothetical protein